MSTCTCGKTLTPKDCAAGSCYNCGVPIDLDSERAVEHWRPQRRPRLLHPWVAADMLRDLVDAHQAKAAMTPGLAEAVEVVTEWLDLVDLDSRHAGYSTNGDPFGAERKGRL